MFQTEIKIKAKPFLKWAGGKTQLITDIEKALPKEFIDKKFIYVEPFVGGGAVLFWILENFPNVEKAIINDINADLTNTYKVIASNPKKLITVLEKFQTKFHSFEKQCFWVIYKFVIILRLCPLDYIDN